MSELTQYPWLNGAWQTLVSSHQHSKTHHAYLFTGIEGLAKHKLAKHWMQFLLCQQSIADQPCGVCKNCLLFQRDGHPDATFVTTEDGKQGISVDQIRALTTWLNLSSQAGGFKTVLIENADRMNANAANALLKTLEEPTGPVVISLVTNHADKLPATIRSRCYKLSIFPPKKNELNTWLRHHKKQSLQTDMPFLNRVGPLKALDLSNTKENEYELVARELKDLLSGRMLLNTIVKRWLAEDLSRQLMIWSYLVQDWIEKALIPNTSDDTQFSEQDIIYFRKKTNYLFKIHREINRSRNLLQGSVNSQLLVEALLVMWQDIKRKSIN